VVPADAVAKDYSKSDADSVTAADAAALALGKILADSAATSDAVTKAVAQLIADSVTAVDAFIAGLLYDRFFGCEEVSSTLNGHMLNEWPLHVDDQCEHVLAADSQPAFGLSRPVADVAIASDPNYLSMGPDGGYARTPHNAAFLVADLDVRVDIMVNDWTMAREQYMVSHAGGSQKRWIFTIGSGGGLILYGSIDGVNWIVSGVGSVPALIDGERLHLRVTRVEATGAVSFYRSTDGVAWTQVGTTQAGTAGALFSTNHELAVGGWGAGGWPPAGNVYYAEVRNGIDGPVVASFNPSLAAPGATTVGSPTGETWNVLGMAAIVNAPIVVSYSKPLTEIVTLSDAPVLGFTKGTLAETCTATDSMVITFAKVVADTVALVDLAIAVAGGKPELNEQVINEGEIN